MANPSTSHQTKSRITAGPAVPLELFVDRADRRGLTRSLYDQLRAAIADGTLAAGDRLPPSRDLARRLAVSRQTITTVYEQLLAEGFVIGRRGGGTFVHSDVRTTPRPPTRAAVPARPAVAAHPIFDQRPGAPDPSLFPAAGWRRHVTAATRSAPLELRDPAGDPALRLALARWLQQSRGMAVDPDQVAVTAGGQAAIDLLVRLLVGPGDTLALEEPGYPPVRRLGDSIGARVVPVPVDDEGLRSDLVPPAARLVYTTPSHQYPLGSVLSTARRLALLDVVERSGGHVLEDDYDSEYRHAPRPLEPLFRLDRGDRVVYVGTFSKTLAPGLRIGFVVLPPHLVEPFLELRRHSDAQPAGLLQVALASFLDDGSFARHLQRTRRVYAARHSVTTEFLERIERSGLIAGFPRSAAGLHVTALLPSEVDEERVLALAAEHDLALGALRPCFAGVGVPGVMLGFGSVGAERLETALTRVGEILHHVSIRA